jgi:hypothetical protein
MQAMLKTPTPRVRQAYKIGEEVADLEALIEGMGKRLQAEYIEGAIPFLRQREPEMWARLEELDREETLEALLEYERLFFEGLHYYMAFLNGERRAA